MLLRWSRVSESTGFELALRSITHFSKKEKGPTMKEVRKHTVHPTGNHWTRLMEGEHHRRRQQGTEDMPTA